MLIDVELFRINLTGPYLRTGDWTQGDGSVDDQSFRELVESIETIGLQVPIIVRFLGFKYQIVSGWRRVAAVKLIAERAGNKTPMIQAILREMTDSEAAVSRVACNQWSPLGPADLAFALHHIKLQAIKGGESWSNNRIAKAAGVSQSYAGRLMRIVDRAPDVAKAWRNDPNQDLSKAVSVAQVERVSKLDPALQADAFAKAKKPPKAPSK